MPLNYDAIMNWPMAEVRQAYSKNFSIRYALGVGANLIDDAADAELEFVWEQRLKAIPTMSAVLALGPFFLQDPKAGVTWNQMLHGEQSIEWYSPLPPSGEVIGLRTIEALHDKGPGRGALLVTRQDLRDARDNMLIAVHRSSLFLRADGGFGGVDTSQKPRPIPDRAADLVSESATRPEQALIYRLSGDWIPLHVDPDFARKAGFKGPILHGMATYGLAGLVVLRQLCAREPTRLRRLDARFSSVVYPGECVRTEIWKEGPGEASFRCLVGDRVVLNNGYVVYEPE